MASSAMIPTGHQELMPLSVRGWTPPLPEVLGEPVDTPPRVHLRRAWLPVEETSAHAARLLVTACCADWALLDLLDTARIGVSELVTNSLRHVRWEAVAPPRLIAVDVTRQGDSGLLIEVFDPDPRLPLVSPRLDAGGMLSLPESGFGIPAVTTLVAEYGGFLDWRLLRLYGRAAGKGVWFSLNALRSGIPAGP